MKSLLVALLVAVVSPLYAHSQYPLEGKWETGKENTIIEIYDKEGVLEGKVVSSDNEKVKIGLIMLKDLRETDGLWKGELFSARRKNWFNVQIRRNGDHLDLEVFSGKRSRSIQWKRND
jgi:uncharacterized protein (DUF2147 family)